MKKLTFILLAVILMLAMAGCDDDENTVWDPAPATPQGVYSVTGDGEVYVYWNGIYESDVREYQVFRSLDPIDNYELIGTVTAVDNPNLDLLIYEYIDDAATNGTTYYYAVVAVDHAGQTSELSAENVFDTPRPEGQVSLFPNNISAATSGFNLETATVVYDTALIADVFLDEFDGLLYINVANSQTDIQDMGYTSSFDEISYSPEMGWSQLGYFEVILGHTYIVWTAEDHFAKMRAVSFNASGSVTFQWAYQTDQGNLELALPVDMERPPHDSEYPKPKTMGLLR